MRGGGAFDSDFELLFAEEFCNARKQCEFPGKRCRDTDVIFLSFESFLFTGLQYNIAAVIF